jgi:hypothetical protein
LGAIRKKEDEADQITVNLQNKILDLEDQMTAKKLEMKQQAGINKERLEGKNVSIAKNNKEEKNVETLQEQSEALERDVADRKKLLEKMKAELIEDQTQVDEEVVSKLKTEVEYFNSVLREAKRAYATADQKSKEAEGKINALQVKLQEQVKANLDSITAFCGNVTDTVYECHQLTQSALEKVNYFILGCKYNV